MSATYVFVESEIANKIGKMYRFFQILKCAILCPISDPVQMLLLVFVLSLHTTASLTSRPIMMSVHRFYS